MRQDEKDKKDRSGQPRATEESLQTRQEVSIAPDNVVFDFTGLRKPDVADLALILTARLKTPLHKSVWVRAIDPMTARVLGPRVSSCSAMKIQEPARHAGPRRLRRPRPRSVRGSSSRLPQCTPVTPGQRSGTILA